MSEPIIFKEKLYGSRKSAYYIETAERPLLVSFDRDYKFDITNVGGVRMRVARTGSARINRKRIRFNIAHSVGHVIPLIKGAVESRLRRVRTEELERLQWIDEQMALLKVQRREAVERAFAKGHVVTVKELAARAEEREDKERGIG